MRIFRLHGNVSFTRRARLPQQRSDIPEINVLKTQRLSQRVFCPYSHAKKLLHVRFNLFLLPVLFSALLSLN
jgi:hypothetical protein